MSAPADAAFSASSAMRPRALWTSSSTASPTWRVRWLSRVLASARPMWVISLWRVSETVAPAVLAGGWLFAPAAFSVLSAARYRGPDTLRSLRIASSPIPSASFPES